MTDLTEQWKKGELPDGWYYTEIDLYENEDYIEIIPNTYNDCFEYGIVKQVLAPVPSYEKWQLIRDDNKRLKHDIGNLSYKIKNQRKEIERQIAQNAQLKDLLEWCRDELFEVYSNEVSHPEDVPIIKKLDEVLK